MVVKSYEQMTDVSIMEVKTYLLIHSDGIYQQDIYDLMNELTNDGVSIIMVSSELPEVLGMSDRIMVVREGMVRGIIGQDEADQEKIMTLATGGTI